ncbi:MAG: DNA polymerase III subunit delta [Cyanobacteria bacterium NC_groundwater_1444_Ag_S-0.65um_54_12]|nr:DNA polymerase III subunit delta [Cyanobacteria bacterium NC_groundwater_1444_Ag_S-0.65um_54_12]
MRSFAGISAPRSPLWRQAMIWLLWGEDSYALAAREQQLTDELVEPAWRSLNLKIFTEAGVSEAEVVQAARTLPFLGNRLVIVRNCSWFSKALSSATSGNEDQAVALPGKRAVRSQNMPDDYSLRALLTEGLPGNCHLILCVPHPIQQRMATTKAMLAAAADGKAQVCEFPAGDPYRPESTVVWLERLARERGSRLAPGVARALVVRLGQDKYLLEQELQKLANHAEDRPISQSDVKLLSPPGDPDIFELLSAVLRRDLAVAVGHLRRISLYEPSLKILATLTTLLRLWLQAKTMQERRLSPEEIAKALGHSPGRVRRDLERVRDWSSRDLLRALGQLAQTEAAIKGSTLPEAIALERFLAMLASR